MTRQTRYAMAKAAAALVAALVCAVAFGALNPEVTPMECASERIDVCGGITPPSATGVVASASCTNFSFALVGITDGSERIDHVRHYYGGSGDCPPDDFLSSRKMRSLSPRFPRWFA